MATPNLMNLTTMSLDEANVGTLEADNIIVNDSMELVMCTANTLLTLDANKMVHSVVLAQNKLMGTDNDTQPQSLDIQSTTGMQASITGPFLNINTPQDLQTTASPTFGLVTLTAVAANRPVFTNATNQLVTSPSIGNGQLIIGRSGLSPVCATLTGTTNRINIANASGSITLSTPQDIHTGASPTFVNATLSGLTASMHVKTNAGKQLVSSAIALTSDVSGTLPIANGGTNSTAALANTKIMVSSGGAIVEGTSSTAPSFASGTLTNTTNQLTLGTTNTVTISAIAPAASRVHTLPDTGINSSFVMADGTSTINGNRTFTGIPTFSVFLASSVPYFNTSKQLSARVLTNGQLLIGATSANPVAATLTGTTNQVSVTNGSGSITLSLPQDIHTAASPTFDSVTMSSATANRPVFTDGSNKLISSPSIGNGQLIIGRSGLSPVCAALTGTTNQVTVTNGSGSITLSLPQDIHTGADPTWHNITANAVLTSVVQYTGDMRVKATNTLYLNPDVTSPVVLVGVGGTNATQFKVYSTASGVTTVPFSVVGKVVTTLNNTLDDNAGGAVFNNIKLVTTGGTPSVLNHYEEYTLNTVLSTGPWTTQPAATFYFTRVGKKVTVQWDALGASATFSAPTTIISTPPISIPARFEPSFGIYLPCIVVSGSNNVLSMVQITNQFVFYGSVTGANFTNQAYIRPGSVTYSVS